MNILGHPGQQEEQGPSVDCGLAAFAKTACRLLQPGAPPPPGTGSSPAAADNVLLSLPCFAYLPTLAETRIGSHVLS